MQHQEKYTFTWHSYSDHLREALNDMMLSSEFADVTLVTDDKQQIRAHRNILSACSPVFKSILQIDSNKANPVIYLRGIQHSEMESILQFIYLGEAKFDEERMNEFLMVSKNLEIKELSTGIEMNGFIQITPSHELPHVGNRKTLLKLDQTSSNEETTEHDNNLVDEDLEIDEDTLKTQIIPKISNKSTKRIQRDSKFRCQDCESIFNSKQAIWYHTKSKHEGVKYTCNQCDQQFTHQSSLTTHIQSIHEGVKCACNLCDQQFTLQSSLTAHIQSIHEGVKYACNQCDYQATQQSHLTRHIQAIHDGVKYACNQCDQQFTQQSNLTKHRRSKHL